MRSFKLGEITIALATAGLLSTQASAAEAQNNQAEPTIEVIEVKGIRSSLIKAQAIKQNSSSIVEVITAEDIGKLPDPSIAETITRLPGIAARRVNGKSSQISIRGLNEDFAATTFNGREQVTLGDNRGVDFSLYPAEIMSGVTVYKTPDATLTTQGIAGVVDLQTVRPLAYGEQTIKVGGTFETNSLGKLNPDGEDTGKRLNIAYIDQFADNTVGLAISANHMTSPTQQQKWLAWGDDAWPTVDHEDTTDNLILGGANPRVRSTLQTRNTLMGVLEYKPNDKLHIVADALYIDYEDEQIQRGIETPAAWSGANMQVLAVEDLETLADGTQGNGTVTHGIIGNTRSVLHGDYQTEKSELQSFGINLDYRLSDALSVNFDASHSSVTRDKWQLETYAGSGRGDGIGVAENIEFWMNEGNQGVTFKSDQDYSDPDVYKIGAALSWGGGNPLYAASDDQDGFLSIIDVEDELTTLRFNASQLIDNSFFTEIQVGVNYSDRSKSKLDTGRYLTLKAYPDMVEVSEDLMLAPTSLEFLGMGNMISYNSKALYDNNYFDEAISDLTELFRASNSWSVSEEITTAYIKADFEQELSSDVYFTGNIGLQVVATDQSSTSYIGSLVPNTDPNIHSDSVVKRSEITDGDTYTNVLPSLNTSLNFYDDHYLRFSVAKTISRSRMDRLRPAFEVNFNTAVNTNNPETDPEFSLDWTPWSANAGSAKLRPLESLNIDLSYEYYFAKDGFISIAGFNKDLKNWQVQKPREYDFSELAEFAPIPADEIAYNKGYVWEWAKVPGGEVNGVELSITLPGHILSETLEGFGLIASATYLDAKIEIDGQEANIPGLSDSIYNLTAFYENNGWQFRTSMRKRDEFPDALGYTNTPKMVDGSTLVDAQIAYDFSASNIKALDGFAVSLQGYNLTDEPFKAYLHNPRLVSDYQTYGRSLLLSASYKF